LNQAGLGWPPKIGRTAACPVSFVVQVARGDSVTIEISAVDNIPPNSIALHRAFQRLLDSSQTARKLLAPEVSHDDERERKKAEDLIDSAEGVLLDALESGELLARYYDKTQDRELAIDNEHWKTAQSPLHSFWSGEVFDLNREGLGKSNGSTAYIVEIDFNKWLKQKGRSEFADSASAPENFWQLSPRPASDAELHRWYDLYSKRAGSDLTRDGIVRAGRKQFRERVTKARFQKLYEKDKPFGGHRRGRRPAKTV
jgi:hypothetical protein